METVLKYLWMNPNQNEIRSIPAEAYSEPCQTSILVLFVKIVNRWLSLTVFAKSSILDILQGSEYVSESCYLLCSLIQRESCPSKSCSLYDKVLKKAFMKISEQEIKSFKTKAKSLCLYKRQKNFCSKLYYLAFTCSKTAMKTAE